MKWHVSIESPPSEADSREGALVTLGQTSSLCSSGIMAKGKRVRHVVISCEDCKGLDRAQALSKLPDIAKDFAKKYAPDSDYIYVAHQDRIHPHAHLIICNSDKKKES